MKQIDSKSLYSNRRTYFISRSIIWIQHLVNGNEKLTGKLSKSVGKNLSLPLSSGIKPGLLDLEINFMPQI